MFPMFGSSGCAMFASKATVKGDTEADTEPEWLTNLKALKGTGDSMGMSPEARDIERSLMAQ